MPALLLSLLPLLGRIAPEILGLAFGGAAEPVAGRVEAALRDIFGTADPAAVAAAVETEPGKAEALKARLAAETVALKAQLGDVADARAATRGLAQAGSPIAWGSPVISTVVVLAFAIVAVVVFARYGVESAVGQLIAGALIAKFGTVVDYWLGTSHGTVERADQITAMLHEAIGTPAARQTAGRGRA